MDEIQPARLVVGLGNPGSEYADTRHNVGFRVLDALAERLGLLFQSPSQLDGWTGPRGFTWARRPASSEVPPAYLLKPGTYMNRSGEIVAPFARWLARRGEMQVVEPDPPSTPDQGPSSNPDAGPSSTPDPGPSSTPDPSSILVVYDDLDLEPARLRLRPHGGHGGQNGMRDIIERLRTDGFPRLRVGIGRAGTDAARHVLSPFSSAEEEVVEVALQESCDALEAWIGGEDLSAVMTRFHSRWKGSG